MKDTQPLVSIIIPVYNCQKYLDRCFTSVLNQTFKAFEVIIINDGSEDDSHTLIKDFKTNNSQFSVRTFNNTKNLGDGFCRNRGIKEAYGRYICFLDADDEYDDEFIEKMYDEIKCGYDLVYCGFDMMYEDSGKTVSYTTNRKFLVDSAEIIRQYMNSSNHFSHASAIYNIEFIVENKLVYNEISKRANDIEFVCSFLLCKPKCSCVTHSLYYYHIRPDSTTTKKDCHNILDSYYAITRVQKKIKNIIARIRFIFSRKASHSFHIAKELYAKQAKVYIPIRIKISLLLLAIFHILKARRRISKINAFSIFYLVKI